MKVENHRWWWRCRVNDTDASCSLLSAPQPELEAHQLMSELNATYHDAGWIYWLEGTEKPC